MMCASDQVSSFTPYASKYELQYYEFEEPKKVELVDMMSGAPVEEALAPFVYEIKAPPEQFTKYDFLYCPDGPGLVVHDRVVKVFEAMCPDDFQTFKVIIKKLDPNDPPFENHDFHMINLTHTIEALDMEKSKFRIGPTGIKFTTYRVFKEDDCWNGHLLAREKLDMNILFHPKLAKKFRRSKGAQFLSDAENHF